ncbi:putative peptidoglycan binding protein [Roseinatronobacter thiooxidans]|uniref:Putative peptidoglycan binding protein n=1 Tax=Roseinatronobacter thiooxidans TaxID=121821 RepID=A0A2W7PTA6_9RHOB|nr:peptidoglycan-binding domain-containing protein [Roseinatronobacter thiooxidans]PZX36940.1 putative peptidoglycan binding protein [Roseinatronobacter thiooxidans]
MIRTIGVAAIIAVTGVMALAQGTVPEGGAVPIEAVPFSTEAVNRAFNRLTDDERSVIQQRLERRGFYQGTVDGLTGPGTRDAIRAQAAVVLATGLDARLDTEEGARTFLTGLLPLPLEELPAGDAFFGVWDCGIGTFSYRYYGYATSPEEPHLPYMSIQEFTPGNYGITYMDGYRTGLMDVTPTTMIWSSPASGDNFDCRRVSAPPPRPEIATTVQPPVRDLIDAVPPAPPAADTALPWQSETKAAPVASAPKTIAWAFEGHWLCISETFEGQTRFEFGADAVTVPAFGTTAGYADVTPIGGRETAFLVNLRDGQQAAVAEIEAGRMILFASGNLFDCARGN